jgi:uncharacterized membrane protein YkvA (DUF1232 family)
MLYNTLPLLGHSLDPRLDCVFAPMCVALSPAKAADLRHAVAAHVERIRAALTTNEFLDMAAAERIADVLTELLGDYARQPELHCALIVGAARYFAEARDVEPDLTSLLGFDDDVQVLNFVLDSIGRADLKVEL